MSKLTGRHWMALTGAVVILVGMTGYTGEAEAASPAAQLVTQQAVDKGLPADFPIPDDAIVVTAVQNDMIQEPFMRLTYHTRLSMELLAKTYSEYFRAQEMTEALQKISEQRLVIQGTDSSTGQRWILTGSPSLEKKGWTEVTLIWNEQ